MYAADLTTYLKKKRTLNGAFSRYSKQRFRHAECRTLKKDMQSKRIILKTCEYVCEINET